MEKFVHEEEPRSVRQRAREGDASSFASAQLSGPMVDARGETRRGEEFHRAFPRRGLGRTGGDGWHHHVLGGGEGRHKV